MEKLIACLPITIILRVITIWNEVLLNLGLLFRVLVSKKEAFYQSSNYIETHFDMVVENIGVHRSVSFYFFPNGGFLVF